MHALPHLTAVDWISLAIFLASWAGYAWFSEHSRGGSGNLMTSVSFYANTTIYIIAALGAALGAADKLLSITAELPFAGVGNRELLEVKLMLLLASFVFAYFKFTWSLRQFNLLSILLGAAPTGRAGEPGIDAYARRLAGANNLAGDDFNRGIRAYYFGLAASGWLLSPFALAVLAIAVLAVLYRRDYRSSAVDVLHDGD